MTISPTQKQHLAYQALKDPNIDTVFLGGGAGGGKSWLLCESRLVNAIRFPGYRSFIGREELKRMMQSTYVTFTKVCAHHKIPTDFWKLNGQYNYIEFKNGSRIDLLDLKFLPTDPMYERLGSLEYTDGAIEEAGEIDFMAYDVIRSRIGRHKNKEFNLHATLLVTGNPKKNWTYTTFYRPWRDGTLPKNTAFVSLFTWIIHILLRSMASSFPLSRTSQLLNALNSATGNMRTTRILSLSLTPFRICIPILRRIISLNTLRPTSPAMEPTRPLFSFGTAFRSIRFTPYPRRIPMMLRGRFVTSPSKKHVPYSRIVVDADGIGEVVDQIKGVRSFIANASPFEVDVISPTGLKGKEKPNFANLKAPVFLQAG